MKKELKLNPMENYLLRTELEKVKQSCIDKITQGRVQYLSKLTYVNSILNKLEEHRKK